MKKILITGSFDGDVALIYGETGIGAETHPPLLQVDMRNARLTDKQKRYILSHVPERYNGDFGQAWATDKLRFMEADADVDFEKDFYWPYGKPVNRDRCLKLWNKYSKTTQCVIAYSLSGYLWHLSQNLWKSKADPESYLKKEMWKTDWYNPGI